MGAAAAVPATQQAHAKTTSERREPDIGEPSGQPECEPRARGGTGWEHTTVHRPAVARNRGPSAKLRGTILELPRPRKPSSRGNPRDLERRTALVRRRLLEYLG